MKNAFTLLELTIVIAIAGILATAALVLFNPAQQINKSMDAKRKSELHALQKATEDFYNDKSAYPNPSQICFGPTTAPRTDQYGKTACTCEICGNKATSPSFSPYMSRLTCDPQSPSKEFLYDFDCSDATKPQWYRIYTKLSNLGDDDRKKVGCEYGCGPDPNYAYHYVVMSPNTSPEISFCVNMTYLYYIGYQGGCDICRSPATGDTCNYANPLYIDSSCTQACQN